MIAVVRRGDGLLLAFERSDVSGEWQLPQGGIEKGESPEEAAWRELGEETGLGRSDVDLVGEHDHWTVYQWPRPMRRGNRFGQVHRWFFFDAKHDEIEPSPDGSEFSDWKWMTTAMLIDRVVDFRKAPYRQVLGG